MYNILLNKNNVFIVFGISLIIKFGRDLMKYKNNGFSLIELITVLVILAIISLILTPVVLNTIKKSSISASKRSVDGYGKAIELSIYTYILENKKDPTSIDDLSIEYTGNKVSCDIININSNKVYLSKCKVGNSYVYDKTDDGYYHYGIVNN